MLYKKYIPKSLDEVFGNKPVINRLQSIEDLGGYCISLIGELGCGKSTIASILADQFSDSENNITVLYCAKIDKFRDELANLRTSSLFGNKKAIILEELHRASDRAQEELIEMINQYLNKNILVISCTTEPDKLIKTVKDRFESYRLYPLSPRDSFGLIGPVSKKENINISKDIKELLVKKAKGNPRRLLIGLSQIRNVSSIEDADYLLEIGSIEEDPDIFQLFKMIINNVKWEGAITSINSLIDKKSPDDIRIGLLNIASGMITSKYYNSANKTYILNLNKKLSKIDNSIPAKTFLKLALYEVFNG